MSGRLANGATLAAALAAIGIAFADSSIVVIALPDVLRRFDASINGVAWVVTAYNLALALGSLALVVLARRSDARLLLRAGIVLFTASSLAAAAAPNLWTLVTARAVQGLGGALLLAGSLPVVRARAPGRGAALWAGAGLLGAALGPAAGGLLTEIFSWRAIFYAQAPLAAVALVASRGPVRTDLDARPVPRRPRIAANAALALVSAALVGLLFLAVVLLIDVWRLSPLTAAAAVSAIPASTVAAQALAARSGSSAATLAGVPLLAGGLAAMGLLPARSVLWAVLALATAGAGLGLVVPELSRIALGGRSAAATTVWARHAGLVAGLLILTPLLSDDLASAADSAKLRATAAVLDSPLPAASKLELAFDLAPILAHPPRKGLPSFSDELARRPPPQAALGGRLDAVVAAAVTRGFRSSFLVAAALALAALVPLALAVSGRLTLAPVVALAAVAALLGAELARGALDYGTRPRVLPPCAKRPSFPGGGVDPATQRLVLKGLDLVACRVHKSREQLVVDLASGGVDAADLAERLAGYAKRLASLPGWLRRLLGG
jgi:MFS family permease